MTQDLFDFRRRRGRALYRVAVAGRQRRAARKARRSSSRKGDTLELYDWGKYDFSKEDPGSRAPGARVCTWHYQDDKNNSYLELGGMRYSDWDGDNGGTTGGHRVVTTVIKQFDLDTIFGAVQRVDQSAVLPAHQEHVSEQHHLQQSRALSRRSLRRRQFAGHRFQHGGGSGRHAEAPAADPRRMVRVLQNGTISVEPAGVVGLPEGRIVQGHRLLEPDVRPVGLGRLQLHLRRQRLHLQRHQLEFSGRAAVQQ